MLRRPPKIQKLRKFREPPTFRMLEQKSATQVVLSSSPVMSTVVNTTVDMHYMHGMLLQPPSVPYPPAVPPDIGLGLATLLHQPLHEDLDLSFCQAVAVAGQQLKQGLRQKHAHRFAVCHSSYCANNTTDAAARTASAD
jgi:hypothetical protein